MLIGKHHIVSVSELAILMFLVNFSSLLVMFHQIHKPFNLVNNIFLYLPKTYFRYTNIFLLLSFFIFAELPILILPF